MIDDDVAAWLASAMAIYDCALVIHPRPDGWQPLLFPRTLCAGQRMRLVPRRRRRKPKP